MTLLGGADEIVVGDVEGLPEFVVAGHHPVREGLRLDALLSPRLEELELQRVYREIEVPLVPVLAEMERLAERENVPIIGLAANW